MQELIGKTVGQYQIVEQIGKGGMASIFKAYQPSIDRYVAVKVLPKELAKDPNFVKRFVQEAKAIAALEHSHILPVHDFGTEGDITYMVMRYVPGGTLSDIMSMEVPVERVTKYVGDVARALDYAHSRGVVHRDIKPSNILIDEQGEVLLTDFGVAKMLEGSESTQLTAAGAVLGTPAYMSPEQAKSSDIDGRSDIYSLGVVLYELLTGQPPYQAETPFAIVLKHLNDPLPMPRIVNPDISEPFERVVLKSMAKDPEDRFATAGEMATALNNALRDTQAPALAAPGPSADVTSHRPAPSQTMADVPPQPAPADQEKSGPSMKVIGAVAVVLACITLCCGAALLLRSASNNNTETVSQAAATVAFGEQPKENDPADTPPPPPPTEPPPAATEAADEPGAEDPAENADPEEETPEETDESDLADQPEALDIDGLESGDVLFEDNFEDNGNEWPEEYLEDDLGYYESFLTEEGEYLISVGSDSDDGHIVWFEPTMDYLTDFVFTIEALAFTDSEDFLYGVVFRSAEDGRAYFFEIDNGGFVVVTIDEEDNWTDLIEYAANDAIIPDEFNELTVEAVGSQLTFFINGQKVAAIRDDGIARGTLGVAAEVFEEDGEITVLYDNMLVTAP